MREMTAVARTEYGGPEQVRTARLPVPDPGPDEVLVEVHAAGLDRGVLHLVQGTPYAVRLAFGVRRPKQPVLGLDLAGRVAAVGDRVSSFAVGDEVLGIGRGSFAEYSVARAAKLVRKPSGLSFSDAASLPVSGLTALQAVEWARLRPGERVTVIGASGGVGVLALQLAKLAGAHVTAVCSGAKADLAESLGADAVVDYATGELPTSDVLFAMGGRAGVRELRRALAPGGRLLIVGTEGGEQVLGISRQLRAVALNPFVRHRMGMLVSRESGEDLQRLVNIAASGAVVPVVGREYPLSQAASAVADLAAGAIRGKAVIRIRS